MCYDKSKYSLRVSSIQTMMSLIIILSLNQNTLGELYGPPRFRMLIFHLDSTNISWADPENVMGGWAGNVFFFTEALGANRDTTLNNTYQLYRKLSRGVKGLH